MRDDREQWTDAWRQPTLQDGDTLLFNEPGRIILKNPVTGAKDNPNDGIDCRSHAYSLVEHGLWSKLTLAVKHGGGEERFALKYEWGFAHAMASLTSDQRYAVFKTIEATVSEAASNAHDETGRKYRVAFIEGRLKKRRKDNKIYVDILAAPPVRKVA